ncbi:hypothetical protein ACFLZZ_00605 [Nanoarchaeota archaeon]
MGKTDVIYGETKNPYVKTVTHVIIQTDTKPAYVWQAIRAGTFNPEEYVKEQFPRVSEDMLLLPIKQAKKLFNFKKGKLEDCV